ncbi:MAG: hypothetical protein M4579_004578 [Chaenotheca gracillima]|nr:MAG: hypothetical protein M4579_004578 [Chaenotheca gracillima]
MAFSRGGRTSARGRGSGRGGGFGGADRGRGGGRGRGRGRGRGGSRPNKPTYNTARVESISEQDSDEQEKASNATDSDLDQLSGNSESDDSEEEDIAPPSYSTLLQNLNAGNQQDGHSRKRRKLEHKHTQVDDEHLDSETEQGIGPAAGISDSDDVGEEDDHDLEEETGASEDDDLDDKKSFDPFHEHIAEPDTGDLARSVRAISEGQFEMSKQEHDKQWKAIINVPLGRDKERRPHTRQVTGLESLPLKAKLKDPATRLKSTLSILEKSVAGYIFNYQDFLFCGRSVKNAQGLRVMSCVHALNHILKTRDKVIKNNAKLANQGVDAEIESQDQGFTRPKVLFLLPTRDCCFRVAETITKLFQPEQQENKKRFSDGFHDAEKKYSEDKPEDFRDLFDGNDDDMFRIGLKFTRKTLKFFSQFYNSDIILASPLGLRMAIGMEDAKKQDHDFLSSIELLVIDQADALLMQNWDHVDYILQHMNLQPKEPHGCDFSRVRPWYLDGQARFLRQTLVLSSFNTPELNQIFSKHMLNVAGKVKLAPLNYEGEIHNLHLASQVKQTFSRFESPSPALDPDTRFNYFISAIAPLLSKKPGRASRNTDDDDAVGNSPTGGGTLLFVPSYLDFVRLRNHFANSNLSFGCISEYTSLRDTARARSHFLSGRHAVMIYTERAHHFRRYRIRGVRRVVFYGLPENPLFYREVAGGFLGLHMEAMEKKGLTIGNAPGGDVRCMFCKWDVLKLERVVGTKRVGAMIREKHGGGDTFDFV